MSYISQMVINTLTKSEEARDDMMLVVKAIHDYEMSVFNVDKKDYYDAVFNGNLSSIKTIDRIWRKVQEDNIPLRGKEWLSRQIQAGIVSQEIASSQLSFFGKG